MKVNVKLFATFRQYAPADAHDGSFSLELSKEGRIGDLVTKLGMPGQPAPPAWIILVNGRRGELDDRLEEGDTLSIFPPIAGG